MSGMEENKRHAFDAFCKRVLKNECINAHVEQARQSQREVTFSELSKAEERQLQYIDEYFPDRRVFRLLGMDVEIADGALVRALAALPADRRDIILLAYLLDLPDMDIAAALNLSRSAVQRRRKSALKELRKLMMEE